MAESVERSDFTPDAQQAFTEAEAEARALQHNYIGQEHLLLGLLSLREGPVPALRERFGLSVDAVREAVMTLIGRGRAPVEGALGLTPRAKRAVQLAVDDARAEWSGQVALGKASEGQRPLVSGADLLYGLLLEGTGVGATVLQSLGLTVEQVREAIRPQLAMHRAARQALAAWGDEARGVKRYLLTLPLDLFEEVQRLADRQQTNVADLLRRFTRLGLLAARLQETPDAALIIREGQSEQRILLL